jgi:pyruvate dehydrogenase E1 component
MRLVVRLYLQKRRRRRSGRSRRPGCATRPAARSTCGSRPAQVEQPKRAMTPELEQRHHPTAPTGCVSPARVASGGDRLYRSRRASEAIDRRWPARRAIAATSACWPSPRPTGSMPAGRRPQRARQRGDHAATSHVEAPARPMLSRRLRRSSTVHGRPPGDAGLARQRSRPSGHQALGVEHFGQTGTVADLYRHFGIDANAIVHAANAAAPGRPVRYLKALP